MQAYKLLSLDESGKASYTHQSKIFILSGVVIPEILKPKIDAKMRLVKKNYFGDESLVFHGRDMARNGNPFQALSDTKIASKFWMEFISIVNNPQISFYFVVTNKINAKKAGWQTKTILERSYLRILSEFARTLKSTSHCGRIINESESEQDPHLIYAHNRLQANGTGDGSVSGKEYQRIVTSLSLVNKANQDIDLQIADVVAFVGRLRYEKEFLKKTTPLTPLEKVKYRLVERKVNTMDNNGLFEVLI